MSEPEPELDRLAPELSVILVVGRRREYAGACLRSLFADAATGSARRRLEVVLVDVGGDAAPLPEAADPRVHRLSMPPDSLFAAARAAGVEAARAPVIAFLEEHTRVRPGWAEALLAAHEGPWVAVGPQMANANPEFGKSALIGLLNYGAYAAGGRRAECRGVPGHNSSYKTEALRRLAPGLADALANDLVLQERLRAAGGRFFFEPAAVVEHRNERGLASIGRGIFLWYRCYGPLRARQAEWSAARRLLYVLAAPVIPFYFVAHTIPRLARARTEGWTLLVRHLPFVLGMQLCGALGQAVGLVQGPGDAPARFTLYELGEPRGPV